MTLWEKDTEGEEVPGEKTGKEALWGHGGQHQHPIWLKPEIILILGFHGSAFNSPDSTVSDNFPTKLC